MPDSNNNPFDQLIARSLDGLLDEAERDQLAEAFENDDVRQTYVRMSIIDSLLTSEHRATDHLNEILADLDQASPGDDLNSSEQINRDPVGLPRDSRQAEEVSTSETELVDVLDERRPWEAAYDFVSNYMTLSLVVSGLFFAILLLSMAQIVPDWKRFVPGNEPKSPSVEFVARITDASEATFDETSDGNYKNRDLFEDDSLVLNAGLVVIEYDTGARVVLEGPATYQIQGANGGALAVGKLVARVDTKTAKGFAVDIPGAQIVDLGTVFGIEVSVDGAADVAVLVGEIEVIGEATPSGSGQRVRLTAGDGASVSAVSQTIEHRQQIDSQRFGAMRTRLIEDHEAPRTGAWADFTGVALIGHWNFDERSGTTARDSSPRGNHAFQTRGGSWVAGRSSGAYDLPRFQLANSRDYHITGAVTVSAWVKPNAANEFSIIAGIDEYAGDDDMFSLKTNSEDEVEWFLTGTATATSTKTLMDFSRASADGWVHLVGVFEPGIASRLYVNGMLNASTSASASIPLNVNDFRIGIYANSIGPFNGAIDDLQVYVGVLSAEEVDFLFQNSGHTVVERLRKD